MRGSCPQGWTVCPDRKGARTRLQYRPAGQKGCGVTLDLPWVADAKDGLVAEIAALVAAVNSGQDLRDAHRRLKKQKEEPTPASGAGPFWAELVAEYEVDFRKHRTRPISDVTWNGDYAKFLNRVVEVMSARHAPTDAGDLIAKAVEKWRDRPRTRQLCIDAIKRLLEFAIDTKRLPRENWQLSQRLAKIQRGPRAKRKAVATPTDAEILQLLDSIPDDAAGERWRNVIKLMAVYGLRPAELLALEPRRHPKDNTAQLFCTYEKVCGETENPARWLLPVPLRDADGKDLHWELAYRMEEGRLPLPPLSDKYALNTFLRRNKYWMELKQKYEQMGYWLRPYSFRNSYSIRIHGRGYKQHEICAAMNHSLATHQHNYEWARHDTVLELLS